MVNSPSKKVLLFFIIIAFFLAGFVSIFFTEFSLDAYQYYIQRELYGCAFLLSFLLLFVFAYKREWSKGLMFFLLPLLVYDFINYTAETVLYGMEIGTLNATAEVFALRNINLSLGDLKVSLVILSLVVWVWVYRRLSCR